MYVLCTGLDTLRKALLSTVPSWGKDEWRRSLSAEPGREKERCWRFLYANPSHPRCGHCGVLVADCSSVDNGHRCLLDLVIWEARGHFQRVLGFILASVGSCCLSLEVRGVLVHVERQDGASA